MRISNHVQKSMLVFIGILENVFGILGVIDQVAFQRVPTIVQSFSLNSSETSAAQNTQTDPTKCIAEIQEALKHLSKKYVIAFVKIDSSHLGDPACRPGVCFFPIRRWAFPGLYLPSAATPLSFFHFFQVVLFTQVKTAKDLEHQCEATCQILISEYCSEVSVSGAFSTLRSKLMLPEDCKL